VIGLGGTTIFMKIGDEIQEVVPKLLRKYNVPGISLSIIHADGESYNYNYGYVDKKNKDLVHTFTRFQVASVSKPITAWGILKLVEDKMLDLDSHAVEYIKKWRLPESDYHNNITIRQILSHTAGLSVSGYYGTTTRNSGFNIVDSLMGKARTKERVYVKQNPSERFDYSGGGYSILQLIIEEITGMSFSDFMYVHILSPLGMSNSTFNPDRMGDVILTSGHDAFGKRLPHRYYVEQAAAGLYTTSQDLTKFMIANMRQDRVDSILNPLLQPSTIKLMHTRIRRDIPYGLGFSVNTINKTRIVSHRGANMGWQSIISMVPDKGIGIVILTNSNNGCNVIHELMEIWFRDQVNASLSEFNKKLMNIQKRHPISIKFVEKWQMITHQLNMKK